MNPPAQGAGAGRGGNDNADRPREAGGNRRVPTRPDDEQVAARPSGSRRPPVMATAVGSSSRGIGEGSPGHPNRKLAESRLLPSFKDQVQDSRYRNTNVVLAYGEHRQQEDASRSRSIPTAVALQPTTPAAPGSNNNSKNTLRSSNRLRATGTATNDPVCDKINAVVGSSGYSCQIVSWDDVGRDGADRGNLTDTYLRERNGRPIYTCRSDNWNEKLGQVSADELAVVVGNHVLPKNEQEPVPLRAITLKDFLMSAGVYSSYVGVDAETNLYEASMDQKVSIRFQAAFIPAERNCAVEFCSGWSNHTVTNSENPRNAVVLCTTRGIAFDQDGDDTGQLLHHAVDARGRVHRYWLEAKPSEHSVDGPQNETEEEAQQAAARGKGTASVIGIRAMGKRFNTMMTVQIPLMQREERPPASASTGAAIVSPNLPILSTTPDTSAMSDPTSEADFGPHCKDQCRATADPSGIGGDLDARRDRRRMSRPDPPPAGAIDQEKRKRKVRHVTAPVRHVTAPTKAPPSSQSMQIFVKAVYGTMNIKFGVESSTTVGTLKNEIRARKGIPPDQQLLIFGRRSLEDECALSDYGIGDNSTLHLALRLSDPVSDRADLRPTLKQSPRGKAGVAGKAAARAEDGTLATTVANTEPVRDPQQHVTVTIVIYHAVVGGAPSVRDVSDAIDDLKRLYRACSRSGKLSDEEAAPAKRSFQAPKRLLVEDRGVVPTATDGTAGAIEDAKKDNKGPPARRSPLRKLRRGILTRWFRSPRNKDS